MIAYSGLLPSDILVDMKDNCKSEASIQVHIGHLLYTDWNNERILWSDWLRSSLYRGMH